MILDLMVWAPTREAFLAGMVSNGLMIQTEDGYQPTADVMIDEIGPISKFISEEESPQEVPGWHANLRAVGQFALDVTHDLDQEGDIFQRTYILHLVPGLEWKEITEEGVPAGWQGPNGVRLFDPSVVQSPMRVWA